MAFVAQRHDARQQSDQDVRVDAPLVCLVNDDDAVLVQKKVLRMVQGRRQNEIRRDFQGFTRQVLYAVM